MEHRIAPPKNAEIKAIIEQLTEQNQARKFEIFKSKQKVLMFAAAFGKHLNARTKLDSRDEPIRMAIFDSACDSGFINALAVAETGTLNILDPDRESERINIFEEYANGGLIEMRRILSAPGDNFEQLLRKAIEMNVPEVETEGVSPDLVRLFGA